MSQRANHKFERTLTGSDTTDISSSLIVKLFPLFARLKTITSNDSTILKPEKVHVLQQQ
jgi:hypothetical protein